VFAKIEHGQARLNSSQVRQEQQRFTAEEYAEFKAQHARDDAANIAAAEKEYQKLMAQDAAGAAAEAKAKNNATRASEKPGERSDWLGLGALGLGGGATGADKTSSNDSSWLNPFGSTSKKTSSDKYSYKGFKKDLKDKATDHIVDYKIRRKFEKDNERRAAGSHVWPWEATKGDDKFMEKEVPMPWDYCMAPRKTASLPPPGGGKPK